jgi:His-Xaa-Ser system protein HxsD
MEFKLDSKIYPLEAILNACYTFLDRAYIFLDKDSKEDNIKVYFKGKNRLSEKQLASLKGKFMNELLHCALRYEISKNNKKIREYIIGRALYSVLPTPDLFPTDEKLDYLKDPLGIAIPWGKKYGKKKKIAPLKV